MASDPFAPKFVRNGNLQSEVDFRVNRRGLPTHQTTLNKIYDNNGNWQANTNDDLTHSYVYFDEPKVTEISGTRTL